MLNSSDIAQCELSQNPQVSRKQCEGDLFVLGGSLQSDPLRSHCALQQSRDPTI